MIFGDKLFENPVKIIKAFNLSEIEDAFKLIEELKSRYYIVGYLRYEAFNSVQSVFPLLYFEVFESFKLYKPDLDKNLLDNINISPKPCVNFCEYKHALETIKDEIACGNTYEVNYTYDFDVCFDGDDFRLFETLLNSQKTPYNFYSKNEYDTVLSFSPELFFTLKNTHILTKPMKGTVKRGQDEREDRTFREFLYNDEKNRAENVMIVDLLRNDLGRIAKTGSVKVPKLFDIEAHRTLYQMTSEVEADLKCGVNLFDIFKAIFPCGSITGAPKKSTMSIIENVEKGERSIYCGAIGMIHKDEAVFSVPIRILQKHTGGNTFKYRVGGAIVWDSGIQDEWEETLVKTKFLNDNFQIIETMKVENGQILFEQEHFERMESAALHFCFKIPDKIFEKPQKTDCTMRVLLYRNGCISTQYRDILPARTNKITISPIVINSKNEFMYYKTTYRPWFYDSYQKIAKGEIYDEIFFNEKGELTEGARSNVILLLNGKMYTPPVKCGLLKGIYRQQMKNVEERVLYKPDIERAQKIYCVNSVRGLVEVVL